MQTNRRARSRRHRIVLVPDLDRVETSSGLWADHGDGREALRSAVRAAVEGALTDKQRAVVEACFFEGLSQGEAAKRLGISQQVVSKTLHGAPRDGRLVGGALRKLREALSPVLMTGLGGYGGAGGGGVPGVCGGNATGSPPEPPHLQR